MYDVSEIAGHNERKILMNGKPTILAIASNADSITLKDGRKEHAGYYLNELVIPVQAALDAGYQMVLATPNGTKPIMDPQSAVAAHFGGSEEALREALNFRNTHPAMQNPRSFRSVIEEGLDWVLRPRGSPTDG
jgi:hypothetical protein